MTRPQSSAETQQVSAPSPDSGGRTAGTVSGHYLIWCDAMGMILAVSTAEGNRGARPFGATVELAVGCLRSRTLVTLDVDESARGSK